MGDEHVGRADEGAPVSAVVRHVVDSISPASEVYADAARRSGVGGALLISSHSGEGLRDLLDALWRRVERVLADEAAHGG